MVLTRMPTAREVAGDGQGHADDAALRRRVGGLADLAVEGGDRGGVDDGAPLVVRRAARSGDMAVAARRMQLNVPTRLTSMTLLEMSRSWAEAYWPSLPMVRVAQPMPAR